MSSRYGGQGRKNVRAYRKGSFKAGIYGYALDAVVYQDANGKWRYAHNDKLAPTDLVTRIHRYENKPPDGKIPEPYTVIDKYGKYTLLSVKIDTGRKNQIRVHLSHIGNPIVGDKKYGASTNLIGRLALHSIFLSIEHPVTRKQMIFEGKIPPLFLR